MLGQFDSWVIRQGIQNNGSCVLVRRIHIGLLKAELGDAQSHVLATPIIRLSKKAGAHEEIGPVMALSLLKISTQPRKLVGNGIGHETPEAHLKTGILKKPFLKVSLAHRSAPIRPETPFGNRAH